MFSLKKALLKFKRIELIFRADILVKTTSYDHPCTAKLLLFVLPLIGEKTQH